jgi:fermentation-respiration switch protein FrsA (DUF1100 family)
VILLVVAYMGVGLFVANRLSERSDSPIQGSPGDVGLEYEDVGFKSEDGVPLRAWWIENGDAERVAVLVHGFGGNRSDEHILQTAPIYASRDYSVLILDLRGHGDSGGQRRTLGYKEVQDVRAAVSWLQDRGYKPEDVLLHGWSMGGATVVRAAPSADVGAVIEEAGYADLPLLLNRELPESSGLPAFFNPGILLSAKLFLNFDPWAVVPKNEAKQLRRKNIPVFIIHSTTDKTVAFEHPRLFRDANSEAEFWRLENYDHVEAYTHPDYEKRLNNFLEEAETPKAASSAAEPTNPGQ